MIDNLQYTPGPATGARIEKDGESWTLVLVRELRHAPKKVWEALTDPAELKGWAPYDVDGNLGRTGATVNLTWVGSPAAQPTKVKRAEAPRVLEFDRIRWELEPVGAGTRLTLWINIDRKWIAMGAAGWHIAFDVLDHLLGGTPIDRIVGPEAMKFEGWQRLNGEYAKQFAAEP